MLILIAKTLESQNIDTAKYLRTNYIKSDTVIDLQTFNRKVAPILGMDFKQISELFLELEKNGKANMKDLIEEINKYRADLQKVQENQLNTSCKLIMDWIEKVLYYL